MPQKAKEKHERFLEQFSMDKEALARLERVAELARGSKGTLIFANTRQVVESLGSKLIYFRSLFCYYLYMLGYKVLMFFDGLPYREHLGV